MDSLNQLPAQLIARAYTASGERAWPRVAALEVLDYLSLWQIAVLGGEVWIPTIPEPTIPTPFIYTWDGGDPRKDEPWEQFVIRVNLLAREYIISFAWDAADQKHSSQLPYFNLTLSSANGVVPDPITH